MKCGGEWQQRQRQFLVSHVYYHYFFFKRRDKGRESPKILFLLEEGMGREGNLGADPLPVFKEERADLGCCELCR